MCTDYQIESPIKNSTHTLGIAYKVISSLRASIIKVELFSILVLEKTKAIQTGRDVNQENQYSAS